MNLESIPQPLHAPLSDDFASLHFPSSHQIIPSHWQQLVTLNQSVPIFRKKEDVLEVSYNLEIKFQHLPQVYVEEILANNSHYFYQRISPNSFVVEPPMSGMIYNIASLILK